MKMPSVKTRKYLYRVGIAGLGVLAAYGLVSGEEIAVWSLAAAALLGLADVNATDAPSE